MTFTLLALAANIGAFAWRCSISGWAPVTNFYETLIWVALAAAIISVVVELAIGGGRIGFAGALVAAVAATIAAIIPPNFGSAINGLPAVLQSNLWLTLHVPTVTSAYAAFAVAMVLANVALVGGHRSAADGGEISAADGRRLTTQLIYRTIQIGVVLLAAGTVLGALWADTAWGRFWGWDPKEVWALAVLLVYLALLHARSAGWVGERGLILGAIGGFMTVLMSWYGVNFLLGAGLHSYGFGSGGAVYVGAYVAAQIAIVLMSYVRSFSRE